MKRIDTSNPDAWVAEKDNGYAPIFRDTKSQRGSGLGTAFGKGVVMEDVLSPPAKTIPREYPLEELHKKSCLLYGAGDHEQYMDMRVNSVINREMLTRFAQFILLPLYLVGYLIIRFTGALEWDELMFVDWGFIITIVALILFDFLKPIATPVRFNYEKQEVYAYHKGTLYRIPWEECEIACMYAPDFMGVGGLADAYSLNLWLYPKHCVKGKAGSDPIPLVLLNEGEYHSELYDYWEYVRCFMTDGPESVYTLEDEKSRSKVVDFSKASKARFILEFPLFLIIYFLTKPKVLYIWLNPFKKKWPQDVHEWTGETINWH